MTYSYTEIRFKDGQEIDRVEKQGEMKQEVTLDRLIEYLSNHTPRDEYDKELNQIHTTDQPLVFGYVFLKAKPKKDDKVLFRIPK